MNKTELAGKIKALEGLTNDEKTALLGLLREQKKYGIVWEDKPEDVEQQLATELPVLTEVKDRYIKGTTPKAPNHILIEGDNLHALTTLSYTHEGKIDVIYIDPPYNTGNKDFVYNDSFVDREDGYRHSKWLSFISKRLKIAKRLLSERGVIFISIDDNEQAQLKMLCDEVFGEENKIGVLPTIMNLKGNQAEFAFAGTHEYTIVYAKSIGNVTPNQLSIDEDLLDDWDEDDIGYFKKGATLKRTGADAARAKRPYCFYPILVHKETLKVTTISEDEYKCIYDKETKTFDDEHIEQLKLKYSQLGYVVIFPYIDGNPASWRWGYSTLLRDSNEVIVTGTKPNFSLYKKQRPEFGQIPTKKPKSVLYKAQYSSGNGTAQLKAIFHEKVFDNPKPLDLICDILQIGSYKDSIILDFFAGSGTTLHSVLQLNQTDKGRRTCILVTNNENNLCQNVTYVRCNKVIKGYEDIDGVIHQGFKNNVLRYYKTDFVSAERTSSSKRALMAAATDMLCIKNNIYQEDPTLGGRKLKASVARHFREGGKEMLVVYNEDAVPAVAELLRTIDVEEKIIVYVFSNTNYAYNDDFQEVADKIELCALPDAIYRAYKSVISRVKPVNVGENNSQDENAEAQSELTLNFEEEAQQ